MNIRVLYDGEYPNLCRGTLTIIVNEETIYNKKYCLHSTGSVLFDEDYSNARVERGHLVWEDSENYSEEIQKAVEEKLSEYHPCCGGCI